MLKYIILFHTHFGAMKFEKSLNKKNLEVLIRPTPRLLTSNCGVCAVISNLKESFEFVDEEVDKIFEFKDNNYKLIYEE